MKTKTQSHIDQKYDCDHKLRLVYQNAKRTISDQNFKFFESYDRTMVREALSKALEQQKESFDKKIEEILEKQGIELKKRI